MWNSVLAFWVYLSVLCRQHSRRLSAGVGHAYLWPIWCNRQTARVAEVAFTRLGYNAESLVTDCKKQCYKGWWVNYILNRLTDATSPRPLYLWLSSAGPVCYQPWVSGRLLAWGAALSRCQVIHRPPGESVWRVLLKWSGVIWCCSTPHFSRFNLWLLADAQHILTRVELCIFNFTTKHEQKKSNKKSAFFAFPRLHTYFCWVSLNQRWLKAN